MGATIHSLPPELLVCICAGASCYGYPDADDGLPPRILGPISFAAVCRRWREIALNHQSLWTHIDTMINIKDPDGKFHSPRLWLTHSRGSPIYVHIVQPRFSNDKDEELYEMLNLDELHDFMPMLGRLISFLTPLMPQVCSLTTALSWPFYSTLGELINCWITNGTLGQAKVLESRAYREFSHLDIPSSTAATAFFESLQVLHLHNTVLSWPDLTFGNLIELEIEMGEGEWITTLSELAAVLASCPRLQKLSFDNLMIEPFPASYPKPVLLGDLKKLLIMGFSDIRVRDKPGMFEAVLAMIQPGWNALDAFLSLVWISESSQVIDAICCFVNRSNVNSLHVEGFSVQSIFNRPCFASQLGPLPRVRTLVLTNWVFCDTLQLSESLIRPDSPTRHYQNPCPINPAITLWPDVQSLFIQHSIFEWEHVQQLISSHSIRDLHMRKCAEGPMSSFWNFYEEMPTSEKYEEALSRVVLKATYYYENDEKWSWAISQTSSLDI